jgi:tRNA-Thr(GGU) m(6)t(6)A37 methyltransferase TsaA
MKPSDPPAMITLSPIATVSNGVSAPQTSGWERIDSLITLVDGLSPELLSDLAGFSHLIVVFWLDRLPEDRPQPTRVSIEGAERSVLATRSQLRPSPIGVSVVSVLDVQGSTVNVRGLDALDGTPVLDLKPYIPYYDSVQSATVPVWVFGGH